MSRAHRPFSCLGGDGKSFVRCRRYSPRSGYASRDIVSRFRRMKGRSMPHPTPPPPDPACPPQPGRRAAQPGRIGLPGRLWHDHRNPGRRRTHALFRNGGKHHRIVRPGCRERDAEPGGRGRDVAAFQRYPAGAHARWLPVARQPGRGGDAGRLLGLPLTDLPPLRANG